MVISGDVEALVRRVSRIVFATGFFDGVHCGHRRIIDSAIALAATNGAEPWALTFDRHPLSLLRPKAAPPLLMTLDARMAALAASGVAGCLLLPFTKSFADLAPEEFVANVFGAWRAVPGAYCGVVCGPNWTFGKGGVGLARNLAALSGGFVDVAIQDYSMYADLPVSSSRIREAVSAGALEEASSMLGGGGYLIEETTLAWPSRTIGTAIGAPTANIVPTAALMPPHGVYIVDVQILSGAEFSPIRRRAVANWGLRPTFADVAGASPVLEVHILDFSAPLYDCKLRVFFLSRIRDEIKFESPQLLARQIQSDIAQARNFT